MKWAYLVGASVAVVLAVVVLKWLPPLGVLALLIGGLWYASHRLRKEEVRARPAGAELLGLKRETEDPFGLLGYPLQLFSRSDEPAIDELVWGPWRGLEVRVFGVSFRAPSLSGAEQRSSFAAALTALDVELPSLLAEPQVFLTRFERPPALARVPTNDDAFEASWSAWSSDPGAARELLDPDAREWLRSLGDRWGVELSGRIAMVYGPRPERADVIPVLEALKELVDHLAASGRTPPPASATGERDQA
jgi:hypothetical protein